MFVRNATVMPPSSSKAATRARTSVPPRPWLPSSSWRRSARSRTATPDGCWSRSAAGSRTSRTILGPSSSRVGRWWTSCRVPSAGRVPRSSSSTSTSTTTVDSWPSGIGPYNQRRSWSRQLRQTNDFKILKLLVWLYSITIKVYHVYICLVLNLHLKWICKIRLLM